MSEAYDLRVAPQVGRILAEWKARHARSPNSAEGLAYKAFKAASARVVTSPNHCGASQYALRKPLNGVYRVKLGPKSRYRMFYIFSHQLKASTILWVEPRQSGKKADAYKVIEKMLRNGVFDDQFAELNLSLPKAAK